MSGPLGPDRSATTRGLIQPQEVDSDRSQDGSAGGATPGLVVGGLGGPEDEVLEDGQEEVFSRTEVLTGKIEHKVEAGGGAAPPAPFGQPS